MIKHTMTRGDDRTIEVKGVTIGGKLLSDPEAPEIDELWVTCKRRLSHSDEQAPIRKTLTGEGITVEGDDLSFNVTRAETSEFPNELVVLKCDIQARTAAGEVVTLELGDSTTWELHVTPDVTRATGDEEPE